MKYPNLFGAVLFIAFIAFIIWWEVSMWNECRETNSFFYCLRVLGR